MPLNKEQFEKLMKPARSMVARVEEGPPRKTILEITDEVTDAELEDVWFPEFVRPGLHPDLTNYQQDRALEEAKQRFWQGAQPDGPDLFTLLKAARTIVERIRPTVDDEGKTVDPTLLEGMKKEEEKKRAEGKGQS